ncbi:MAG: serine/threonine-protein kinase [Myxococcota bacterium]
MTSAASTRPSGHPSAATGQSATLHDDAAPTKEEAHLSRGQVVGHYVILERVGSGGMGVVYAAYDKALDRRVAIKLLHARRRPRHGKDDARLLREAQAMARLAHPNVVAVHEVGTFRERPFVAMEFVDGQTLSEWLEEKTRPWREVVAMLLQAGEGLAAAHAQGLIHRDFKPENVLVGHDGRARVVDFGLARASGDFSRDDLASVDEDISSQNSASIKLTETGALTGTPAYMGPEQFRGRTPDARSDQFAYCITLWEALFGERPFRGDTRARLAMAVCTGDIHEPAGRDVPTFLRRALRRGLSIDRDERFESMDLLLTAIDRDPVRSRRRIVAATAAAVGIAALSAGIARWSGSADAPCEGTEARIATAWNDDRQAAMDDAFQRVDAEFAAASFETVTRELDRYADDWSEGYRDACEAAHVRRDQSMALFDRRMACLDQRLSTLEATTALLADADRDAIAYSIRAVTALPPVDECADAERMMARFAPPDDPLVAKQVDTARARLAHASVLGLTGRAKEGLDEARAVRHQAEALAYLPLQAEAIFHQGVLAVSAGQPHESLALLHDAVDEAIASGHDEVLVGATTRLMSVVGVSLSRYEEAERWGRMASAALRRRGQDPSDTIPLARNLCMMLADKGDITAALTHCREALRLSIEHHGEEHAVTSLAYRALGNAYYWGADFERAEEAYELSTKLFLQSHGLDHPEYPALLNSLAAVCYSQKKGDSCIPLFEQTVEAAVKGYGADHPATADFTNNLAIVLLDHGRLDEAEARSLESLELRRAQFGDDHPGVGAAHRVLARVAHARGKHEQAREHADKAVQILEATRGKQHLDVQAALSTRARIRTAAGDPAGGIEDLRAALAIAEGLERAPVELAELRFELAKALFDHREEDRAQARAMAAAAEGEAAGNELAAKIADWRATAIKAPDPAP